MAAGTKKSQAGPGRDSYLELVIKFSLRPLRTGKELDRAIEMIDSLLIRGDLEPGEQDYLDILADIVEKRWRQVSAISREHLEHWRQEGMVKSSTSEFVAFLRDLRVLAVNLFVEETSRPTA
jgi:hypothetical protein